MSALPLKADMLSVEHRCLLSAKSGRSQSWLRGHPRLTQSHKPKLGSGVGLKPLVIDETDLLVGSLLVLQAKLNPCRLCRCRSN